jgi:hypothetical protein
MSCREYRKELTEVARGGPAPRGLADHLDTCAECAGFLDEQTSLTSALQSLAAEAAIPGRALEARIMAELPDGHIPVWRWVLAAGIALAACLSAFTMLQRTPAVPQLSAAQPFVNIPYTVPLAPEEPAEVWQAKIPVSALIAVGFHLESLDPSATVEAEILVSQDGRARAIRPISISHSN